MEDIGAMPELHLKRKGSIETYLKPHAPYALRSHEVPAYLGCMAEIKVPTSYSASIGLRVCEKKFYGFKTHDYHVIMQQLLLAMIWGSLFDGARNDIIRLGHMFQ
jgi:hypothetical protein